LVVVRDPFDASCPDRCQVALSDGSKFTPAGVWKTGDLGWPFYPFLADVNDDKKADLVFWFLGIQ
jgi:hypothetical protein